MPFIIVPALITCLLSTGIYLKFEIVRSVYYLYTPLHAKWKQEDNVFQEWAKKNDRFYPGGVTYLLRLTKIN